MPLVLRALMWLCLIVWIGGIIFFSAIEAPSVFQVLGSADVRHLAGDIVNRSLSSLHYIGFACGVLFILCRLALRPSSATKTALRAGWIEIACIAAMLLLTAFSQFWITPGMHLIRQTNPQLEQMAADVPARAQFDKLHRTSTYVEGGVLLLGLVTVVLLSRGAPYDTRA